MSRNGDCHPQQNDRPSELGGVEFAAAAPSKSEEVNGMEGGDVADRERHQTLH